MGAAGRCGGNGLSAFDSLGVVVLTYGTSGVHRELLRSLQAAGVPAERIVVAHNPASPGEPDPELPPGCDLVRCPRNGGYTAGMNSGLRRWRERRDTPPLLLLLTHDASPRDGAVGALLVAAKARPEFGILAPVQLEAGSDEPFSYGGDSDHRGVTTHRKLLPSPLEDGVGRCDWVDGGAMLVRAEVFERVGEFDERFWSYCDDSDLCLRARRAGFGVGVVPAAVADQDPGADKRPGSWAYLLTRNSLEYVRRAAGRKAVVWAIGREIRYLGLCLARIPVRVVRPRPTGLAEPWALAAGTALGMAAFLLRRWGPPPPWLPGIGDVANA